ncbi:hypothetical protein GGP41_008588 [Bipolaris sorokiniana]|uniref:Uncharacterized protein n=2 Tax=Cochliobolus sativus TaxID=45130 RepID=A0A8H6DSF9_COCSA|nr:uncharacterized protein COCSADRAFT_193766 [Bipolaris sorokiniana ND90Pr]EMD59627.1 hypothetical protein COCSADRAFT_193766 [Bipolaris sorokiniana ND90Pr]KAF5846153.1 hypothetical protein GGP41_008588 [Bipolaris sorokiniana]
MADVMQLGRQASRVERGAHVECLSGVLRVDHWLWLATEPYKVLQRTDWTRICQSGPYAFMALRPECQPVVFVSPSCTQPSFPCLIRLVASYQRHRMALAARIDRRAAETLIGLSIPMDGSWARMGGEAALERILVSFTACSVRVTACASFMLAPKPDVLVPGAGAQASWANGISSLPEIICKNIYVRAHKLKYMSKLEPTPGIPVEHGPDRRHKRVDLDVNPAVAVLPLLSPVLVSPLLTLRLADR